MNVVPAHDVGLDVLERQVVSVRRRNRERVGLRVESDAAGFVEVDVGSSIEENRVGRLREVGADGELVGLKTQTVSGSS